MVIGSIILLLLVLGYAAYVASLIFAHQRVSRRATEIGRRLLSQAARSFAARDRAGAEHRLGETDLLPSARSAKAE
jgi:hypothetical protein